MRKMSGAFFLIAFVLVAVYFYSNFLLTSNATSTTLIIAAGESANQIGAHLKEEGIIRSTLIFKTYIWLKRLGGTIQIGEYEIRPRTPLFQLVKTITASPEQREKKITLIEGWTVRDIGFYLENLGIEQAEGFWELVGFEAIDYRKNSDLPAPKDFSATYDFLADKPAYLGLEGYLFPDTYRIPASGTANDVVSKMLDNFGKKLTTELRIEIRRQGKTIFDIVRMASIIEREVQQPEDKKIVADIFWRRLAIGMPLQADSTVNYVTRKGVAQASRADIQIDSPWNTYKYKGLPLGPIGNPGMESMLAATYPKPNTYIYFLTDKDGNVHYAKTLEEHNSNKNRYLSR